MMPRLYRLQTGACALLPVADRRGAVGMEFVMILPLMLILLFGTYEGTALIGAHTRMDYATTMVANIAAKQATVTPALLADYCDAAKFIMSPYGTTPLAMAIMSVSGYSSGTAVDWQYDAACPTTATSVASATAVNYVSANYHSYSEITGANQSVILVYATYTYKPIVAYVLTGPITMTRTASAWTRSHFSIPCTGC
jgi:Flp pilus assembly protein TadG